MATFILTCEHCSGTLEAEEEWIGQTANCHHCGGDITIQLPQKPAGMRVTKAVQIPSAAVESTASDVAKRPSASKATMAAAKDSSSSISSPPPGRKKILSTCSKCKKSTIIHDESLCGEESICEYCGTPVYVPFPEMEIENLAQTKECHFCGESILLQAKKCKHCGEFLDNQEVSPKKQRSAIKCPVAIAAASVIVKNRLAWLIAGTPLLALFLYVFLEGFFWYAFYWVLIVKIVGITSVFENTFNVITFVFIVMYNLIVYLTYGVITSLFIAMDKRWLAAAGHDTSNLGTFGPVYLFNRAKRFNHSKAYSIVGIILILWMLIAMLIAVVHASQAIYKTYRDEMRKSQEGHTPVAPAAMSKEKQTYIHDVEILAGTDAVIDKTKGKYNPDPHKALGILADPYKTFSPDEIDAAYLKAYREKFYAK